MRLLCESAFALVFLLAAVGCGGVEVSLQLRRGAPDVETDGLQTLRVFLEDDDGIKNDVTIPVEKNEQAALPDVRAEKNTPFSIDVWGCESADQCEDADVAVQGCVKVDLSKQRSGEPIPIPVDMFAAGDVEVEGCRSKS